MTTPSARRLALASLLSTFVVLPAFAQPAPAAPLKAEAAWVRASVPGQAGTGAFMRLTASEPLTLVGVASPVAGVAELHEMKLEGDVMRMRAISSLALPAGQSVELRPGGHHLMLMDLKAPLKPDTRVPLTLVLRDAKGAERRLELQVPVSARPPAGAASGEAHGHPHGHGHTHPHGHPKP
jgi:copper(I)-binding protein